MFDETDKMFDWKKPTVQMLGRWQPWHDGHTELFKKALKKTGQVCIMYIDVEGVDAGVEGQADNPFGFEEVKKNIIMRLSKHNLKKEGIMWSLKCQILLIFPMAAVLDTHSLNMI